MNRRRPVVCPNGARMRQPRATRWSLATESTENSEEGFGKNDQDIHRMRMESGSCPCDGFGGWHRRDKIRLALVLSHPLGVLGLVLWVATGRREKAVTRSHAR